MARAVHKFSPATPLVIEGQYRGRFAFDGTLLQVIVLPQDKETTYDFSIIDEDGLPVFNKLGNRGIVCISELDIVLFPGEKNILIQNSNKDGLFRIKLIYTQ